MQEKKPGSKTLTTANAWVCILVCGRYSREHTVPSSGAINNSILMRYIDADRTTLATCTYSQSKFWSQRHSIGFSRKWGLQIVRFNLHAQGVFIMLLVIGAFPGCNKHKSSWSFHWM